MVACGDADGAVTGNTRRFGASLDKIMQVVDVRNGEIYVWIKHGCPQRQNYFCWRYKCS